MATQPAPVVTAFDWVPDFAKGLVRDLRVRWAFEEIGAPYAVEKFGAANPRPDDYVELAAVRAGARVPRRRCRDLRDRRDPALHRAKSTTRCCRRTSGRAGRRSPGCSPALNSVEPSLHALFRLRRVQHGQGRGPRAPRKRSCRCCKQKLKRVERCARRRRLARRRVLDRRHHDGDGAQQPEGHRLRRGISRPRRIPRARHGAPGLQARARRAAGRLRRPAAARKRLSHAPRRFRDPGAGGQAARPISRWRNGSTRR